MQASVQNLQNYHGCNQNEEIERLANKYADDLHGGQRKPHAKSWQDAAIHYCEGYRKALERVREKWPSLQEVFDQGGLGDEGTYLWLSERLGLNLGKSDET